MGTGASENQVSRRRQAIVKILRAAVIMAVVFFIMPINVCAATSDTEFFNEEQYKFLKECVEKDDIATWNAWRENASQDRVLLSEADLQGAHLWEANLQGAILGGAKLQGAYL